jgi:uncharacterized membrane protein (DUF485 family)
MQPPRKPDIHSEEFLRALMRRQLRLSILCALAFLVVLLGLPLANYFWPEFMAQRIFGFTLTWFLLGLGFFPAVWAIAFYFIRSSMALEEAEVAEVLGGNHQIPNPKNQISTKDQAPTGGGLAGLWVFGIWSFSGVWSLVLGG